MSIQQDQEEAESFTLGSSVYGGRPTFMLVRENKRSSPELTLYELLPTNQANARRRRLKKRRQRASQTRSIEEVVTSELEGDEWSWDDWVAVKVRRLSGARLRSILPLLDEALRETGTDPNQVTGTGDATLLIREASGVRLSLGFIGVKPIKRVDRMRALARGVARMSLEECYYWYAKCRSPNSPSGKKALRTLLTEHK